MTTTHLTKAKRIFVSNRLPYSINSKTGELVRGSGGLVSALLDVNLDAPFAWMGFETNPSHVQRLKDETRDINPNQEICPVLLDKKIYDSYYDNFCNDVLWPLFHYEGQYATFRRAHWNSYVKANEKMAEEIIKIANPSDTVWIHDFHFLLLPRLIKERNPNLKVGLFLHIPFPSSEIYRQLPVREEILRSMVSADLIGFHEHSYLRHFTAALKGHLGIDSNFFKAEVGDHMLQLGVYPISIDTEHYSQKAREPEVIDQVNKYFEQIQSDFLILGVDRLDYTKGIDLKLRGFRRALEKYPELKGKITLLQVAVPTRVTVGSYIRLKKEVDRLIGTINGEFGQPGYTPVQYIFNSVTQIELLALYRRAQCALVTSKRDGMNLVAMEFAMAQDPEQGGVLILSEFAGAASLLGSSIIVNPWDEDSIADAIYTSYRMPLLEKQERLAGMHEILSKYSASQWASSFLKDLESNQRYEHFRPVLKFSPHRKAWPMALTRKIEHASKIRLVIDYDGTLVGIQKRPGQAVLPPETSQLIDELREKLEVIVLSGRPRSFMDAQFKHTPYGMAAEHGAFYCGPDGQWTSRLSSDLRSWYHDVEKVMEAYTERVPLSFVEKKEASLVWHFRESPPDFANFQAKKLDEELQVGLANQPVTVVIGHKIVEAKAVECNKGHFLRSLMQQDEEPTLYICIGDDRTDEDMFRAVGRTGLSIKVGFEDTAANYRLWRQDEVIIFLRELLNYLKTEKGLSAEEGASTSSSTATVPGSAPGPAPTSSTH
jgi:trehalose 6-phosphate synthase/phosphatase